jgi:ribosomal protein S18 acetylase RimI-like enzyme
MSAMATSEPQLTVKQSLTPSQLDEVGALVREARWNQLAADWRVFLAFGRLYTAQTEDGRIVATTATLPYGGRFAWISMVLVTADYRRRGLATKLMQWAMRDLAARDLVAVLDATPDGRAVYRRLGFEDAWGFQRLRRERRGAGAAVAPLADVIVRPLAPADWPALCAYDAAAFGAERGAVLAGLRGRLAAADLVATRGEGIAGFLLGRDGGLAGHIGPLIAEDDAIARALVARALAAIEGPLFIDVADSKAELRSFLDAHGFAPVRPFTRMLYGASTRFDDAARTFAVVGPEFG